MCVAVVKAVVLITGETNIRGSLHSSRRLWPAEGVTRVQVTITGLSPGRHGFHIHALGFHRFHGGPTDLQRHAGDLGNTIAGSDGFAEVSIVDNQIPLTGQHSILGRAVVVHSDPDDLGKGGHELSKTTGNAGARIGCGIIGLRSSV